MLFVEEHRLSARSTVALECGAKAAEAPLSPGAQVSGAPHADTFRGVLLRRSADCAARKKRCSAGLRTALETSERRLKDYVVASGHIPGLRKTPITLSNICFTFAKLQGDGRAIFPAFFGCARGRCAIIAAIHPGYRVTFTKTSEQR